MSQKTGDSYAMPSISYPDETRRDIASNSLSLSLSPSRTSTRPRARIHDVYTTAVRRARARAHNSPRALARRPVLLAPRRNRGPLLTMIPSVPPRYTDGCSSRDEGGTGRRERREEGNTRRGPPIEESNQGSRNGIRDEGRYERGKESKAEENEEGCVFRPIYTLPSSSSSLSFSRDPPPTRINAYLSQAASSPAERADEKSALSVLRPDKSPPERIMSRHYSC